LARWVEVHAERIADAAYLDILVKGIFVAIIGEDAEVALSKRHLGFTGRIICDVSIRDILNVTDNPVQYLGNLEVCLVICRDNLAAWPILSLIVGYLLNVLREFVDGEAWPGTSSLPGRRATG
jgi:hypothetical protein